MTVEVRLPQWGGGTSEATVTAWLKKVGERIAEGEPLVEVETAKASDEIVSPISGVLIEIRAEEGEEVPVGEVLARIKPADTE